MLGRQIEEALSGVALLVFLAAALFVAMAILDGCAVAKTAERQLPEYCYDEELLRAKVFACVASAETKAESQSCRKQSLKACGIEMTP